MLIDTHCHLDVPAFPDLEQVWERARAAGIDAAIVPGVEPASWSRTRQTALVGERFFALGIHPQALPDLSDREVTEGLGDLEHRARNWGAVAIGECGLDGSIDLDRAPFARQKQVLCAHIEIARRVDLPLIIHVFRAHGEAVALLRDLDLPRVPGVIHSYSGSAELVRDYLSLGFYLSFSGAITRPTARRPVAAARAVPLERLVLETDAPDQPPTGAPPSGSNGRRCEPSHLRLTLARLAEIRGESQEHLAAATTLNARTLFQLDLLQADPTSL